MHRIILFGQYSKSNTTICRGCHENIWKNDIRLYIYYNGFEDYHIECFKPKAMQYICEKDISIDFSGPDEQRFRLWLENWNSKYLPIDKPYNSPPVLLKKEKSKPSKYRRAWIEIFRFISPAEAASKLSLVCKEFYHIMWDEELWHFYYNNEFPATNKEISNWKNLYISMILQTCVGCHKIIKKGYFYRCPLLKKPLCYLCQSTKKFRIVSKSEVKCKYQINPNLLEVKFCLGRESSAACYNFMVKKAITEYREKNKQRILKGFENMPEYLDIKEMLDSINLAKIHKSKPPDINLIENPFYDDYDKLVKYLNNKEGAKRLRVFLKG